MLDILSVHRDVVKDTANADQNGELNYAQFCRYSKRAELALIDWLSGGITNERLPIPWVSQKNKDWLSPFITKYPKQVVDGEIPKPADYYQWENFYRLGTSVVSDCDDDDSPKDEFNTPIEILSGAQFTDRCNTSIEELQVTLKKPISKLIGKKIQVAPKDLGSVCLEYIRMPIFGSITTKNDPIYNEWDEWARPFLIFFITDFYTNTTREQAEKQFNQASNPKG